MRENALFNWALGVSAAVHLTALFVRVAPAPAPERPLTDRDITFLVAQLLPPASEPGDGVPVPPADGVAEPATPADPLMDRYDEALERFDRLLKAMQDVEPTPPAPPPMTAAPVETPGDILRGLAIVRYVQDVVGPRVRAKLELPDGAHPDVVEIQVEIRRDGTVASISFLLHATEAALNGAARKAIEAAAPFPSLEDRIDMDSIKVNCRFDFHALR